MAYEPTKLSREELERRLQLCATALDLIDVAAVRLELAYGMYASAVPELIERRDDNDLPRFLLGEESLKYTRLARDTIEAARLRLEAINEHELPDH